MGARSSVPPRDPALGVRGAAERLGDTPCRGCWPPCCERLFQLHAKHNVDKAFCFQRLISCSCEPRCRRERSSASSSLSGSSPGCISQMFLRM